MLIFVEQMKDIIEEVYRDYVMDCLNKNKLNCIVSIKQFVDDFVKYAESKEE